MKTEPCAEWLEGIESAALAEPSSGLANHLQVCAGCREELRVLRALAGPLAALPLDEPSAGFVEGVRERCRPLPQPSWFAPAALLLAGGAGGSMALAAVCALALGLWLGTERVVTALGFLAADYSAVLSDLLDAPSIPGPVAVGVALAIAAALAAALALFGRIAGGARQLSPR